MENTIPSLSESTKHYGLRTEKYCAPPGNKKRAVTATSMMHAMYAQDAGPSLMALKAALELRKSNPVTPYQTEAWCRELAHLGLLSHFSKIPEGLRYGFVLNFPTILFTQIPPNKQSVTVYKEHFDSCIQKEIKNSRYLGPFSADTLASLISPFQTSPLSVIPKPGKLGKFRLIQNFSFPHSFDPQFPTPVHGRVILNHV
jgi:hypothetical protein